MVFYVVVLSKNSLVENLFISLRVLSESSKTCYFHPVSTLQLSAMVSMSHIYCLQIARLY